MKAVIKNVLVNRDRETTNKETGEVSTTKDNRLVYRITEATPEELEKFKAFRGEKYEECPVTGQPIHFDWGYSEPTVTVTIATDKQGKDYVFKSKHIGLMLAEQELSQAKANDDADEVRSLRSDIRSLKSDILNKLIKFIERNEKVVTSAEVPGTEL